MPKNGQIPLKKLEEIALYCIANGARCSVKKQSEDTIRFPCVLSEGVADKFCPYHGEKLIYVWVDSSSHGVETMKYECSLKRRLTGE